MVRSDAQLWVPLNRVDDFRLVDRLATILDVRTYLSYLARLPPGSILGANPSRRWTLVILLSGLDTCFGGKSDPPTSDFSWPSASAATILTKIKDLVGRQGTVATESD